LGSFVVLRKLVDGQLQKIVKNLVKQPRRKVGVPIGASGMIRDFYKSGMDSKRRARLGLSPIRHWLDAINKIKTQDELLPTSRQA